MTRESMNMELMRVWSEERKTVVFITHSIPEAAVLLGVIAWSSCRRDPAGFRKWGRSISNAHEASKRWHASLR